MGNLFDINKLPAQEGILVFPISMSNVSTSQSAAKCFEYMRHFSPKKILKPVVGLNFIYGDYLSFNSHEKASELKKKFSQSIINHKNAFLKILNKASLKTGSPKYIIQAYSFTTWNQLYLECKGNFTNYLAQAKKIYQKDKEFQRYIKEDAKGRKLDENQINFFIEEIVMSYLILKGKVSLHNEFIQHREKWVLWAYPGKPLKSKIYFFQKNFFKLKNPQNKYENSHYNLKEKVLYDFSKIDLKEF